MIHHLAHVDSESLVAPCAEVWQFASVIRGAVVAAKASIGGNAIVDGAKIGARSRVGHSASIHPGTVIGADVFVGPHAVFCNDRWPSADREGFDAEALKERASILVEDGASICAGAIILNGVRIGAGAVIAAGAVVRRDVPAGRVYRKDHYIGPVPDNWREKRMRFVA